MPLTPEDEQVIARAVVAGLAKWTLACFLVGAVMVIVAFIWRVFV